MSETTTLTFGLQQSATRRGGRMMSSATELRAVQADRKLQVPGSHLPEIIDIVLTNERNEKTLPSIRLAQTAGGA